MIARTACLVFSSYFPVLGLGLIEASRMPFT